MLLRLVLLSILLTGVAWGEDISSKWTTTKDSLIDVNWTDKNGIRMFFFINENGNITVRTGSVEKRGELKDKNDKAISSFVEYVYTLKQGDAKDGEITLGIQRRVDGKKEYIRPRFKSYEELKDFDTYIAYFSKFVK